VKQTTPNVLRTKRVQIWSWYAHYNTYIQHA